MFVDAVFLLLLLQLSAPKSLFFSPLVETRGSEVAAGEAVSLLSCCESETSDIFLPLSTCANVNDLHGVCPC